MRKLSLFLLLLFILANASAQKATDYRKQQNYKEWVHIAPKFDDDFFKTEEAQRIGDNVLLYQQTTFICFFTTKSLLFFAFMPFLSPFYQITSLPIQ